MKKQKIKTNSKYNGIVNFLASVLTVFFILGIPAMIYCSIVFHSFLYIIIYIPCCLINLFLVWGLDNALKRVNLLENILARKIDLNEEDYIFELTGQNSKEH